MERPCRHTRLISVELCCDLTSWPNGSGKQTSCNIKSTVWSYARQNLCTRQLREDDEENNKNQKSDKDGTETALRTFKGKCNKCHEFWHKAKYCPKKKKKKKKNGNMNKAESSKQAGAVVDLKSRKKCLHCSKNGHVEADCWKSRVGQGSAKEEQ